MEQKKILIICNSFWPDIDPRSFRSSELVKELTRQSYQVSVMKPNITHEQRQYAKKYGFEFVDLGRFKSEPLIQCENKICALVGRVINRVLQLFLEYPYIKLFFLVSNALKETKEKFDLSISIAVPYPIHWGTARAIGRNKFTNMWIADCGDPFMGDESDSFRHPFYFKYVEKYFCRRASYLTVPTAQSYKGYYEEFWKKIKVIPQGFDFSEVKKSEEKHNFNCPAFGYAGGVIPNYREPFDFLDYLCTVKDDFRFIVYTANDDYFKPYLEKLGGKLLIFEPEERTKVLYEFSKLDFVVNFNNKGSNQRASKLIDYYIINRPILNLPFRAFDKLNFELFMLGDYSGQYIVENPAQYEIKSVAKEFINLIES